MITADTFRQWALSFPETTEQAHFEKISFKVGKKVFATYDGATNRACIRLSEIDQDVFSRFDQSVVWPVPGKWGKQGWTFIDLGLIHPAMFTDALTTAYCTVAPKHLSASYSRQERPESAAEVRYFI